MDAAPEPSATGETGPVTQKSLYTGLFVIGIPLLWLAAPLSTIFWIVGASSVLILGHASMLEPGVVSDSCERRNCYAQTGMSADMESSCLFVLAGKRIRIRRDCLDRWISSFIPSVSPLLASTSPRPLLLCPFRSLTRGRSIWRAMAKRLDACCAICSCMHAFVHTTRGQRKR